MSVLRQVGVLSLLVGTIFGQGWIGAKLVWQPDSVAPYMATPLPVTDNNGTPWLLWQRWNVSHPDSTMIRELSRWERSQWSEPQSIPDTINPFGSYWDAIFDDSNRLFLIYPMRPYGNLCDIQSVRYDPATGEWELPVQVNAPDTTSLDDYYPRIDAGGGQVWAVWFNETDTRGISDIKASQWNESEHSWGPEMTVNPDTGGINRREWFPDIAVDRNGTPHVIWTRHTPDIPGDLLYSRYENNEWSPPKLLSDSLIVYGPYGGTRPRLVDDSSGNLHCIFIGARPGDTITGLYYCRYTLCAGWNKPVRTDTWTVPNQPIWDKDLGVSGPDDIWVAFDRGGGSDWMIFAQHCDGQNWGPEIRIDDGKTRRGGIPKLTLDGSGCPVVVWRADTTSITGCLQLWYNRYTIAGILETSSPLATNGNGSLRATIFSSLIRFSYSLQKSDYIQLTIYDRTGRYVFQVFKGYQDAGNHMIEWDAQGVSAGVYFCRLESSSREERCKFILLSN